MWHLSPQVICPLLRNLKNSSRWGVGVADEALRFMERQKNEALVMKAEIEGRTFLPQPDALHDDHGDGYDDDQHHDEGQDDDEVLHDDNLHKDDLHDDDIQDNIFQDDVLFNDSPADEVLQDDDLSDDSLHDDDHHDDSLHDGGEGG